MSKYNKSKLTMAGKLLASLAANGKAKFEITRAASTADDLSGVDLDGLEALPHEVQSAEIVDQVKPIDGNAAVTGTEVQFVNEKLTESYLIRAIGLYATKDGEDKEQLYAVITAETPELMPDYADKVWFRFTSTIYVIVGDVANVTVNITPTGLASREYVDKAIEEHKVILPESLMYSDKEATVEALWTYNTTPVDKAGSPFVAKGTADTAYVRNNGDGTINAGDWRFEPADKEHTVQRRENGTAEKTNYDAGDLTIDGDTVVIGTIEFYENEIDQRDAFAKTHPHAQILTLSGDRPTDTTSTTDTGATTGTDTSGTTGTTTA